MNFNTIVEFAKCFSNESRLQLIQVLANRELCVCELESVTGLNQANISQHLRLLYNSDLVLKRRDGQLIYYSFNRETFEECLQDLRQFVSNPTFPDDIKIKLENIEYDNKVERCKTQEIKTCKGVRES